jgi:hypothetical protein
MRNTKKGKGKNKADDSNEEKNARSGGEISKQSGRIFHTFPQDLNLLLDLHP